MQSAARSAVVPHSAHPAGGTLSGIVSVTVISIGYVKEGGDVIGNGGELERATAGASWTRLLPRSREVVHRCLSQGSGFWDGCQVFARWPKSRVTAPVREPVPSRA